MSLLGVVIKIYEKYQEVKKTPEQRAFSSLLKFISQISYDLLKEINYREKKNTSEFQVNWNTLEIDFLKPFEDEKNSEWNSYLPDHPAILKIRTKIINLLEKEGYDLDDISTFAIKFNIQIENRAKDDGDIKNFYEWWTSEQQYKDLADYLEYVKNKAEYSESLGKIHLREYYIKQDAVFVRKKTWNSKVKTIRDSYLKDILDIKKLLDIELFNSLRRYIVIGAPFGIGKTSTVKIIASDLASRYLSVNINSIPSNSIDSYIPILVVLNKGLRVEYQGNWNNLDDILDSIIFPSNNVPSQSRKVLLILDGLDEYLDDKNDLMKYVNSILSKFKNMKAIITTRLTPDLLEEDMKVDIDRYIRLLPFDSNQVNEFFQLYGVSLTYQYVRDILHLEDEEITKPLFTWMISQMHSASDIQINFKNTWSSKMNKSLMYLLFFHHTIKGKYILNEDKDLQKEIYFKEKETLRRISAIRQIFNGDLIIGRDGETYDESNTVVIQKKLKGFLPIIDTSKELDNILKSYFYVQNTNTGMAINFLHNTLKEYLLAEYYLESLLDDRSYRLNMIGPTDETMEFLEGLIELISIKDNDIDRFIIHDDRSLIKSFNLKIKSKNEVIEKLKEITSKVINDEHILISNSDFQASEENIWIYANIDSNGYENLWIHRWISLFIFNKLISQTEREQTNHVNSLVQHIEKEKLRILILNTSYFTPNKCKNLNYIDLSSVNLSYSELEGANLANSILCNSNLNYCNLHLANLYNSKLSNTRLIGAYLSYANLSHADLTKSNLSRADLTASIFDNADLTSAEIKRAEFSYSKISHAKLKQTDLTGSYLYEFNLSHSNLSKSILIGTDITSANFCDTILIGCTKYDKMICLNTNFENAIIDNEELIYYLKNNGAKNIPQSINNMTDLYKKLKEKYMQDDEIKILLNLSILKNTELKNVKAK